MSSENTCAKEFLDRLERDGVQCPPFDDATRKSILDIFEGHEQCETAWTHFVECARCRSYYIHVLFPSVRNSVLEDLAGIIVVGLQNPEQDANPQKDEQEQ